MKNTNVNPQDALNDIRNMMEKSSRFISLSGLSGVIVGLMATSSVLLICNIYGINPVDIDFDEIQSMPDGFYNEILKYSSLLLVSCILVSILMTIRKSNKMGISVWGKSSKRLLINMLIPLFAGMIICYLLFFKNIELVLPLSMVFYGMSLLNASKFTHESLRSLGIIEMILGIIGIIYVPYQILLWIAGFGIMHIIYGTYMYLIMDKNNA